jgi:hypothetical protein
MRKPKPTIDHTATPVADGLGLRSIIVGLSGDLTALRAGKISPADGLARAAVAKQIFNGVRLYMIAIRSLEDLAKPVGGDATDATLIEGSAE